MTDDTTGGTWTSSDTGIVTVSLTGLVTRILEGTVTITYTLPTGCSVSVSITGPAAT
ncbi:TPA: hypothetical protein DCZ39_06950 [Patescibacteria group bacterium]|nr:hypothetical protein [Candidatus Gracilibacteria bacterium]